MAMNNRLLRPRVSGRPLLDVVSGAAAAYSFRRLSTSYTGPVVRVRRSSDNAEANFTATEVAGGVLASWIGADNGFVRTWFDQSGNGRDVGQATSTAQPRMASSGVIDTLNGKPSMLWEDTLDRALNGATMSTGNDITFLSVLAPVDTGRYHRIFHIGSDDTDKQVAAFTFMSATANDWQADDFAFVGDGPGTGRAPRILSSGPVWTSSNTTQRYVFGVLGPTQSVAYVGKSQIAYRVQSAGNVYNHTNASFWVGNRGGTGSVNFQTFVGRMQELVIWTSNKNSNRTKIDSNVSSFYGV